MLPKINPDFIYLDGPDQFNIKSNKSYAQKELMFHQSDMRL